MRLLAGLTGMFALIGSLLLVLTPTRMFDLLIPWLLLFAFIIMLFGRSAADWLHARVTIGWRTLLATQSLLGIYGGYFGGGVGLILTALYGLLAHVRPRELFALRTAMLAVANLSAAFVFIALGMISWEACLPMLIGSVAGGWLGAIAGRRMSHRAVRVWTLLVTGATTATFFLRAYG